jgi:hypothetical protein
MKTLFQPDRGSLRVKLQKSAIIYKLTPSAHGQRQNNSIQIFTFVIYAALLYGNILQRQ